MGKARPRRGELRPAGDEKQHRTSRDPFDQLLDKLHGRRVAPVSVLEDAQQGALGGQPLKLPQQG